MRIIKYEVANGNTSLQVGDYLYESRWLANILPKINPPLTDEEAAEVFRQTQDACAAPVTITKLTP